MAGRGAQTFKKRQKEQQRKEKQQEKLAKRAERKRLGPDAPGDDIEELAEAPLSGPIDYGLADVEAALLPDIKTNY